MGRLLRKLRQVGVPQLLPHPGIQLQLQIPNGQKLSDTTTEELQDMPLTLQHVSYLTKHWSITSRHEQCHAVAWV